MRKKIGMGGACSERVQWVKAFAAKPDALS